MRWAAFALLAGACFSPSFDECRVVCGAAGCPAGLECAPSGYCHAPGQPDQCAQAPDASIPIEEDADLPTDGMSLDGPCEIELIQNGGFEATQGAPRESLPWVASGTPLPAYLMTGEDAFVAHGGSWGVRFGGQNDQEQFLEQSLGTMPPGTSALRLSFHYMTLSTEPLLLRDIVDFELREGPNLLGTFTYIDGAVQQLSWTREDASRTGNFGGRQLSLRVHLTTDGQDLSAFPIDDVSLRAVVCE